MVSTSEKGGELLPSAVPGPERTRSPGPVIQEVDLGQVQVDLGRFWFRLDWDWSELRQSLRDRGQLTPVVLWGETAPYSILDGHRRCQAARELGWRSVHALVREDLTVAEAYEASYRENVERRKLNLLERAHAIWLALHDGGLTREELADRFGLSQEQISGFLALLWIQPSLRQHLTDHSINMAQALRLRDLSREECEALVAAIRDEGTSGSELESRLDGLGPPRGTPSGGVWNVPGGFALGAVEYTQGLSRAGKLRVLADLRHALTLVERDLYGGQRRPSPA